MNLTIVGLGCVGTSLGLALKAAAPGLTIVGHDPDAEQAGRARRLGAVDRTHWNLISACEGADIVVLDLPLDGLEITLQALGNDLSRQVEGGDRPAGGPVLVDTCSVKRPVMDLAQRLLPPGVSFVGGHIVPRVMARVEPPSAERTATLALQPSADLLREAVFYLVVPEDADERAVDAVTNLALAAGATPRYISALEHDGLAAAYRHLPLAAALALALTLERRPDPPGPKDPQAPGAIEPELQALAAMVGCASGPPGPVLAANADQLLPRLEAYIAALTRLRDALSAPAEQEGASPALGDLVDEAYAQVVSWMSPPPPASAPGAAPQTFWQKVFAPAGRRRSR